MISIYQFSSSFLQSDKRMCQNHELFLSLEYPRELSQSNNNSHISLLQTRSYWTSYVIPRNRSNFIQYPILNNFWNSYVSFGFVSSCSASTFGRKLKSENDLASDSSNNDDIGAFGTGAVSFCGSDLPKIDAKIC